MPPSTPKLPGRRLRAPARQSVEAGTPSALIKFRNWKAQNRRTGHTGPTKKCVTGRSPYHSNPPRPTRIKRHGLQRKFVTGVVPNLCRRECGLPSAREPVGKPPTASVAVCCPPPQCLFPMTRMKSPDRMPPRMLFDPDALGRYREDQFNLGHVGGEAHTATHGGA